MPKVIIPLREDEKQSGAFREGKQRSEKSPRVERCRNTPAIIIEPSSERVFKGIRSKLFLQSFRPSTKRNPHRRGCRLKKFRPCDIPVPAPRSLVEFASSYLAAILNCPGDSGEISVSVERNARKRVECARGSSTKREEKRRENKTIPVGLATYELLKNTSAPLNRRIYGGCFLPEASFFLKAAESEGKCPRVACPKWPRSFFPSACHANTFCTTIYSGRNLPSGSVIDSCESWILKDDDEPRRN